MKYTFRIPHSRGAIASQQATPQYIPKPTEDIRDVILHALIARIAYTDNNTEEFLIRLQDDHILEVTISRERLDQLINEVEVGPKVRDYIDWLTGKRISDLEDQIANIPHASKTVYGIVKIGDNIDVDDGVISVAGGLVWKTVVTVVDYEIITVPIHVICRNEVNVILPSASTLGDRVVIKNATADKIVTIVGSLDGVTDATLAHYESVSLLYNGVDWSII